MGRSKNSEYSSGAKSHRRSDSYQAIVAAWKDGGLTGLKQHMTAAVAGFSDHTQDLLAAASDGHSAVVRQLLAAGADGAAALRDAVRAEDTRAVKQLLGAVTMTSALRKAVSGADEDGRTPLHIAAYSGFAVKLLLDAGAAVSAADKQGRTPLHEATVVVEDETLELLIAARAAVAAADKQGRTPLHEAAAAGHAATVELLLAAGATVHAADKDGTNPLHDAACWGSEDDGTSYARTDHRPDKAAWKKKLQEQRKEAVRLLMASGADACTADAVCHTPLLLAAERGRSSIVEVLLSTSSKQVQAGRIAAVQQAAIDAGHTDTAAVLGAAAALAASGSQDAAQSDAAGGSSLQGMQQQPCLQNAPGHQSSVDETAAAAAAAGAVMLSIKTEPRSVDETAAADHGAGQEAAGGAVPLFGSIKVEPGTPDEDASAAATGAATSSGAAGCKDAGGWSGEQPSAEATLGPLATKLRQQAEAAGIPPNEQQRDYFLLADQPFDGPQLLKLYRDKLAPRLDTQYRVLRNGAVAERSSGHLGPSHVERVYPELAVAFDKLLASLEEAHQQQQQQQQQEQAAKKRKLCSHDTTAAAIAAAAAAAAHEVSNAALKLLLALRCLLLWEGRQHREQQMPLLLQLLLFGGPAPAVVGVVECIDLASRDNDESLNMQLMQGGAELLLVREALPKRQQQKHAGTGSSSYL